MSTVIEQVQKLQSERDAYEREVKQLKSIIQRWNSNMKRSLVELKDSPISFRIDRLSFSHAMDNVLEENVGYEKGSQTDMWREQLEKEAEANK